MIYKNELIFCFQLFFISILLFYFFKKKYSDVLSQVLLYFLIFLNLMSQYEIILFGIHCSVVEPFAIIVYFVTIYLYTWNAEKIDQMFKNLYFIHLLICFMLFCISFYNIQSSENLMKLFINNYIWNTIISLISFRVTYYIERYVYRIINMINEPYRQSISVVISQLFDTCFYTILIFYNKSFFIIMNIIFFSYIIKLICIFIYTLVLKYSSIKKY